jgi:hypothetical protein
MAFLFNNLLHDLNAKIKDGKLIVDSSSEEESIYPIRQVGPNAFIVNYNGKPVRAYIAEYKVVSIFIASTMITGSPSFNISPLEARIFIIVPGMGAFIDKLL